VVRSSVCGSPSSAWSISILDSSSQLLVGSKKKLVIEIYGES
jgi:hypothetical protein